MTRARTVLRECELCNFSTEDYKEFNQHALAHLTGRGVLTFHSETGTEGGWWAFQDDAYRGIPDDTKFRCQRCGLWWDKKRTPEKPPVWTGETSGHHYCPPDEHVFVLNWPDGYWSYYGLHVLGDGDHLTIYDKDDPNTIVWEGVIDMVRLPAFTEDVRGMWVNVEQIGVDRETWTGWFFNEYPAVLTKRETE